MQPALLHAGDVVRVVAPSGAFDRARFDAGIEIIRAAGLVPRYDDGLFAKERYLAGPDTRRLAELEAALADREAAAVWVARGGYGAGRLLPLDLGAVARASKWLIGFSDATALHAAWSKAGVVSLHGANVTTLGDWSPEARQDLFASLFSGAQRVLQGTPAAGAVVRGALVGGNLTVLASLAGTGTLPSTDGALVLLEDIGERPYRLDRSITQLKRAGFFTGARGVVVGQLTGCSDPQGNDSEAVEVVMETLADLGLPTVTGFPIGHEPSARAVLLGRPMLLDPAAGTLGSA